MATPTESARKMLLAFTKGDDAAFRAAAQELIEEERKRNHHVVARDLEKILANGNGVAHRKLEALSGRGASELPRDRERGVLLVELREDPRTLDDLVLAPSLRAVLDRVVVESRSSDALRAHGMQPVSKILFCGPPGCGKTVAAQAIANALYLPLAVVRFDAVISSYLGETATNLRRVFEFARSRPVVLFFDELDAVGKRRDDAEEHGELKRVVSSFLQMLDGFRSDGITIAATNHQGLLDPALWRRFDEIVYFDLPDDHAIEALLIRMLRQIGVSPALPLGEAARQLVGMSFADVERIGIDVLKQCILESRTQVDPKIFRTAVERHLKRLSIKNTAAGGTHDRGSR